VPGGYRVTAVPAIFRLSWEAAPMAYRPLSVLILCTGNSARSILAEAIFNREGQGRVRAFSAGSHPKGAPHPIAIALLREQGHDTGGLRSKSWTEFAGENAPQLDVVITVCDAAAGESCPLWPGSPIKGHWGVADPAAVQGSEDIKRAAFRATYQQLKARVAAFLRLPLETMDRPALTKVLREIAALEGATEMARSAHSG
jgi:protein-tyrosine-phosphatase